MSPPTPSGAPPPLNLPSRVRPRRCMPGLQHRSFENPDEIGLLPTLGSAPPQDIDALIAAESNGPAGTFVSDLLAGSFPMPGAGTPGFRPSARALPSWRARPGTAAVARVNHRSPGR